MSRHCFLNCRDLLFKAVNNFSMVEIKFYKCQDWESQSRSSWDKSRPLELLRCPFQTEIETLTKIRIYQDFMVIETVETWIFNCQENLDCRDVVFQIVVIETLNREGVEINWDPRTFKYPNWT